MIYSATDEVFMLRISIDEFKRISEEEAKKHNAAQPVYRFVGIASTAKEYFPQEESVLLYQNLEELKPFNPLHFQKYKYILGFQHSYFLKGYTINDSIDYNFGPEIDRKVLEPLLNSTQIPADKKLLESLSIVTNGYDINDGKITLKIHFVTENKALAEEFLKKRRNYLGYDEDHLEIVSMKDLMLGQLSSGSGQMGE